MFPPHHGCRRILVGGIVICWLVLLEPACNTAPGGSNVTPDNIASDDSCDNTACEQRGKRDGSDGGSSQTTVVPELVAEWGRGILPDDSPPYESCCPGTECLCGPGDLAVDSKGNVYVIEVGRDRVKKFSPEGEVLLQWGWDKPQLSGVPCGHVGYPSDLDIDADDNVFVAESSAQCVSRFDSHGNYIAGWAIPMCQTITTTPCPLELAAGPHDRVYVSPQANPEYGVSVYDGSGNLVDAWYDLVPDDVEPPDIGWSVASVTAADDGHVYVAVCPGCWLLVFDTAGNRVQQVNLSKFFTGPYDPDAYSPMHGIAILGSLDAGGVLATYHGGYPYILLLHLDFSFAGKFGQFLPHPCGPDQKLPGVVCGPSGIDITQSRIYVADHQRGKILVFEY
jgi:hypothetical protein